MSTYLIASDGSENSKLAQEFLANLPFPEKPKAQLLAVTPIPVTLSEYYIEGVLIQQAHQIQNTVVAPRTQAEAERLKPAFASVATDLRIGDPSTEIIAAAKECSADVIVMGARGLSAIPRFLLGSVSDSICRHASQSVLVVRSNPHASVTPGHTTGALPRRILFATDGSAASNKAIDRLSAWAWPKDAIARVVIAHQHVRAFGYEIVHTEEPYLTAERLEAEAILESAAKRLSRVFSQVETAILEVDQIAHSVVSDADQWKADLLVIGSRGKSRWERFLLGSTSLGILHHAHCSIWLEK